METIDLVTTAKSAAKQVVGKGKIRAAYAAIDQSLIGKPVDYYTVCEAIYSISPDGVIRSKILRLYDEKLREAAAKPATASGTAVIEHLLDESSPVPTPSPSDDSTTPSEPAKPKTKKKSKSKKSPKQAKKGHPKGWLRKVYDHIVGS